MFSSIRAYFKEGQITKVLQECRQYQYTNQLEAMRACNRLFRHTDKDYSIVKHQHESLFWVVRTPSAKILADQGHIILKPYKS